MRRQSLYQTYQRYRTLQTDIITALPIVILMPHSACNCRCVMCDIWKGNKNLKQLTETDVAGLMRSLKKLRTVQVVMSGGEAILHPNFFTLCGILKKHHLKITLLTSGHAIKRHAEMLVKYVDDIIISLDGDEPVHNSIRNVENAFAKTKESVHLIKSLKPGYKISGRTVIHQLNFRIWPKIVEAAKEMKLDSISFLPADVTSTAFNHAEGWDDAVKNQLLINESQLPELKKIVEELIEYNSGDFARGYIKETPEKIWKIYEYYAAFAGLNDFPYRKCNAPWVSAVVEADGSVKPCFFHNVIGNIKNNTFDQILNSEKAIHFRKDLNTCENPVCKRCVCSLNLPPGVNPAAN
ncbi:radical SAM protein [Danxiaibacter flavus]|uniref:Radical SAM protein n=1 Tax=Danxiaibacter flavus TaxID=3049108 RepID=A0ABV3Z9W5_9BACT|nr:radical SAM protein [Chitinophagaceae bacterium DXS]